MICERCHEREAHVKINAFVNGQRQTLNLCNECAKALQDGLQGGNAFNADQLSKALFEFLNNAMRLQGGSLNQQDEEIDESLYTDTCLQALQLAKEASRELKSQAVGTEHLLVGLLKAGEGIAYELLHANNANDAEVLELIRKFLISNYRVMEFSGHNYTPMALRILREAVELAGTYRAEKCGTEHVLLAILNHTNCSGARILNSLSISVEHLHQDLIHVLQTGDFRNGEKKTKIRGGAESKSASRRFDTPNLDRYSRDLSVLAENGQLDPVIGRKTEIDRLIQILSRRTKNDPCLIGEPGVGKTAVVEGLAERIASGDVPEIMLDKRIVSLDLTSMVAGSKYRGEFEERIKNVLNEVTNDPRIILFIDEIHTIIGAGGAEGSLDAANILKPALSRGELQLVGATTISEYRKHIEKDSALERRFQPVMVEEPTAEEALEILKGLRLKYEEHHQVRISDAALEEAVSLSIRYIQDRFLPDKAIDLMDEAGSKLRLSTYRKPKEILKLEEELSLIESELEKLVLNEAENGEALSRLAKKRARKQAQFEQMQKKLSTTEPENRPIVQAEDIQDVISSWTKIPLKSIQESESGRLRKLEDTLRNRVIAQDEAVTAVAKAIRRGRVGLKDPRRPIGSFLFMGPTGVGKTELSKALSEAVFGSEKSMIRVDMSEYMEKHSVSKLIGSPPGYVGYDEGGQLSEKVRRNPYSVLLFDEIEKAHPDVFNILLQVLDDGQITDSQGRKVDFKNTIIIMTSNLGAETILAPKSLGFGAKADDQADYLKMKDRVLEVLKKTFKPEFLNRIDEILVFHPLTKENMKDIVRIMLKELTKRVKTQTGIKLVFTEKAKAFLIEKGYDPKFGARPLRRAIQQYVEDALSDEILIGNIEKGDTVTVSPGAGCLNYRKKKQNG